MKTKKLLVALFAIMMAFTVAAQGPGKGKCKEHKTPEERAKKQTEWMKTDLQLTEAQAAEVEKINLKYAIENEKMKQEMKEKKKANHAQKNAELKSVLSPEQYTKLEQIRKEKREQRKMKKQHMKNCMKETEVNQPK